MSCFCSLAIMNSVAVNIRVQVFVRTYVLRPLGCRPGQNRKLIAESPTLRFTFWGPGFQAAPFYLPTSSSWALRPLHNFSECLLQWLFKKNFFILGIRVGVTCYHGIAFALLSEISWLAFVRVYFSILCSVPLIYVSVPPLMAYSPDYCSYIISLEVCRMISPFVLFFFSFQNYFAYSSSFVFLYTFYDNLASSTRSLPGILIVIVLNLHFNLWRTGIFPMLNIAIPEPPMSLHLFRSALISFVSTQ